MYHSINFGDVNTYDDWLLVPSNRPVFNPPKQKTQILDIPGANGSLDISETLTGYPVFENRNGSIEFIVLNDYIGYRWEEVYSNVMNYLHGHQMKCVLEDDPGYFYKGRFEVNQWNTQKDWSRITIDYDLNPYKWYMASSLDEWEWDPFNFRTGVIQSTLFKNIEVESDDEWTIKTFPAAMFGDAPVSPDFIVNSQSGNGMDVKWSELNGSMTDVFHLANGTQRLYQLMIYRRGITFGFKGKGTISIDFRKGSL